MHQAQSQSANSQLNGTDSSNCGLDVKPCLSGSGGGSGSSNAQSQQQAPKQREGTHSQSQSTSNSQNSNSNSQNLNNHSSVHTNNNNNNNGSNTTSTAHHHQLNGSLFDSATSHQAAAAAASYGAYENSYLGYPQTTNSVFQSNLRSSTMNNNSPSSNHKPQRTKARTSAGKIETRCGEIFMCFGLEGCFVRISILFKLRENSLLLN
jgi:hypothetical protein